MKLNLLTSQKISTFLLSILFYTFQLKCDEQFKQCLDAEQTNSSGFDLAKMYETIKNFSSNLPDKTNFCCDVLLKCGVMTTPTECGFLVTPRKFVQCDTIGNSKSCIAYGASSLPSALCGGILGNANPINATEGTCPSPNTIRKTLNGQETVPDKFSWLCCKDENCKLPAAENVKLYDPTNISPTQNATLGCTSDE